VVISGNTDAVMGLKAKPAMVAADRVQGCAGEIRTARNREQLQVSGPLSGPHSCAKPPYRRAVDAVRTRRPLDNRKANGALIVSLTGVW
jgi:hypothetical protein